MDDHGIKGRRPSVRSEGERGLAGIRDNRRGAGRDEEERSEGVEDIGDSCYGMLCRYDPSFGLKGR